MSVGDQKVVFLRLSAEFRWIYNCHDCGRPTAGDCDLLVAGDPEDLLKMIDRSPPPNRMPVGWTSYGNGVFRCPSCGKAREKSREVSN